MNGKKEFATLALSEIVEEAKQGTVEGEGMGKTLKGQQNGKGSSGGGGDGDGEVSANSATQLLETKIKYTKKVGKQEKKRKLEEMKLKEAPIALHTVPASVSTGGEAGKGEGKAGKEGEEGEENVKGWEGVDMMVEKEKALADKIEEEEAVAEKEGEEAVAEKEGEKDQQVGSMINDFAFAQILSSLLHYLFILHSCIQYFSTTFGWN
jgi:hypothetical protein